MWIILHLMLTSKLLPWVQLFTLHLLWDFFFNIKFVIGNLWSLVQIFRWLVAIRFLIICVWNFFCRKVNEYFPSPIALSWKASGPESYNATGDNRQGTLVFPKGNPIPSVKPLTFYRSGKFFVDVHYADVRDLQTPSKISTYMVIGQQNCS